MKSLAQLYSTIIVIFAVLTTTGWAQEERNLVEDYEVHSSFPHEIAYAHLNKSVLFQGEHLTLTAYVYDRNLRQPSVLTRNLYLKLIDDSQNVVKESMLLVNQGTATTVVDIDSTLAVGDYRLQLFTNWMKNQNDEPEFIAPIRILNADVKLGENLNPNTSSVDFQYLPEGGHLVASIKNTIGIVAKDALGKPVAIDKGLVLEDGKPIATFQTNAQGLGRTYLVPQPLKSYAFQFSVNGKQVTQPVVGVQEDGMILNLNPLNQNITLTLEMNEESLDRWSGDYTIAIHNSKNMNSIDARMDSVSKTFVLNREDLTPGVNLITVFNDQNVPVLERVFFNYDNLPHQKISKARATVVMDSIQFDIQLDKAQTAYQNGLVSVGIYPPETLMLNNELHLASRFLMGSYIKGTISQPSYYFKDVDRRVIYDMDNLMIAQGWTSYDWSNLYSASNKPKFTFDQGISMEGSVGSTKSKNFFIYPLRNSTSAVVALEDQQKQFVIEELYPMEGEDLRMSEVNSKGKNVVPKLSARFNPSSIPSYFSDQKAEPLKLYVDVTDHLEVRPFAKGAEQLDAVLIQAKKEEERFTMIRNRERGSVDIFDDTDRAKNINLSFYLSKRGFTTDNRDGIFTIYSNSRGSGGFGEPTIIVDDNVYTDVSILTTLDPGIIDYVVISRDGIGERVPNKAGVIKIYTDPSLSPSKTYENSVGTYSIPLVFEEKKQYYVPKYTNYTSEFFQKTGIIGFGNSVSIAPNGSFQVIAPNVGLSSYLLVIEGFDENGNLVSGTFVVELP